MTANKRNNLTTGSEYKFLTCMVDSESDSNLFSTSVKPEIKKTQIKGILRRKPRHISRKML